MKFNSYFIFSSKLIILLLILLNSHVKYLQALKINSFSNMTPLPLLGMKKYVDNGKTIKEKIEDLGATTLKKCKIAY